MLKIQLNLRASCMSGRYAYVAQSRAPLAARAAPRRPAVTVAAGKLNPTIYRRESRRIMKALVTRQALKTVLHYLSETNGELHLYLHTYLVDHPFSLDSDADQWLSDLASQPLTKVSDPGRASVVTVQASDAVLKGEREVSPRDVADRVLKLREYIAKEMEEDLSDIPKDNEGVLRAVLERTFKAL